MSERTKIRCLFTLSDTDERVSLYLTRAQIMLSNYIDTELKNIPPDGIKLVRIEVKTHRECITVLNSFFNDGTLVDLADTYIMDMLILATQLQINSLEKCLLQRIYRSYPTEIGLPDTVDKNRADVFKRDAYNKLYKKN